MRGLFLDSEAITTTWGSPKAYVRKWLGVLFVFPTRNQATFRRQNINLIFHKTKFHKSSESRNNLLSFPGLFWGGWGGDHPTQVDENYTIVGCTLGFDCQR